MFLLLNGLAMLLLLFYFGPWLFSRVTAATVITPYEANKIHIAYTVNGQTYYDSHMRNGIEFSQRVVPVRYLSFHPQTSRVNSFMGMWAEPLAWWGVFLVASAMLLLTHNGVFSKGTIFQLHRKFPWISMEEYFPLRHGRYYRWDNEEERNESSAESSAQNHTTHLLE
ncbi:MAG TPA: hypothetical protein VFS31_02890 [Chitinophagaceae bacterium]|nr:hypothetical protein [Chitinophagaceae bacterium]